MGDEFFCFWSFLFLIPLILAIIALVRANRAHNEVDKLRRAVSLLSTHPPVALPSTHVASPPPAVVKVPPPTKTEAPLPAPPSATREESFARIAHPTPPAVLAKPPTPPAPPRPTIPYKPPTSAPSAPPVPLEQRLIRLAIWVAGFAFALAGIFLVKVAFENHYLTPAARISIGTLFGVVLLAAGFWRRHKEPAIAQTLSAAGIADFFACFLAATNIYHLVDPITGFFLLVATTALAVVLSLRQGPFIALLGLVGGFLTPALIHTDHPSALNLFGYLLLLHAGLITVTRARQWAWLAILTVLASFSWVGLWLITQPWNLLDAPVLGAFVLLSTAFVAVSAGLQEAAWRTNPLWARILTYLTLSIGLALSAVLLACSHFSSTEWLFLGLLAAGCFTLARIRSAYEPCVWFASAFILALLAAWSVFPRGDFDRLQIILPAFAILFSLAAYACLWGSRSPVRWATLSVISALAYTLFAYFALGHSPRPDTWALLPLGVATLYTLLTIPIYRRRATLRTGDGTLATFVIGVLLALSFAPPMCLEGALLTAVWSLLIPLTAFLATRLRLNDLYSLLIAFAVLVTAALVINPNIFNYQTGPALFWNPLIWAYIPTLISLITAIFLLDREKFTTLSSTLQAAAALIALAFVTLFTHRIFHADTLTSTAIDLTERSTYPFAWFLLASAFLALGFRFKRPVLTTCGYITTTITILFVLTTQTLLLNPLWTHDNLGDTIIFNKLLYMYGLPALLTAAITFWLRRRPDSAAQTFAQFGAITSLILLFVLTTLEIRHAFNGPVLGTYETGNFLSTLTERATYPMLWLLLAFPLLALGQQFKNRTFSVAGYLFAIAGLAFTLFIQIFIANPLWTSDDVGNFLIINRLLYTYGIPALFAAGLAFWLFNSDDPAARIFARFACITAILFLFVLVSLEVRQAFQGPLLNTPTHPSSAEMYAYSAAWGLLGTILLIAGIITRGPILRWASLAVMLLTILKVFLFDTANLSDIYRVFSFAGLGVSLILLGFLYHYFIFRRPPPPAPTTEPEPGPTP